MSGSGPYAEGGPGELPAAHQPAVTATRVPARPDDVANLDEQGREGFHLAVDAAFQLLHGTEIRALRALIAEMDHRTDHVAEFAALAELVTCWRDMRAILRRIDIEDEGDYREAWAENS